MAFQKRIAFPATLFSHPLQLRGRSWIHLAHQPQHRQAKQDECSAQQRAFEIAQKTVNEHDGRAENKDGRKQRIAPDLVWTWQVRPPATVNEHRAGYEHVENPLGKDGQLEMLL